MKRLRETRESDPLRERARQLLAQVAPLAPSDASMRRVRDAIDARQRDAGRRRPRALILAATTLCMASTLAAAQSLGVLSYVLEQVTILAAPARPAAKPSERARTARPARKLEAPAPSQPRALPEAPPAPEKKPAVHPRLADNELVRRALKALRRDGDAALAARTLEEVHTRNPNGALAEEVMSLRVEAALARKDARATGYAREYLARYPGGRYRAQVEKALQP